MKTQKLAAAAVVITCLGAALPALNWAQEEEARIEEQSLRAQEFAQRQMAEDQKEAVKAAAKVQVGEIRIRQNTFPGWAGPSGPAWPPEPKGIQRHLTQIQEAAEHYCNATNETGKEKALQRLRGLASKYFEEDMEVRKNELAEIEARLAKLRSQLNRRSTRKNEIVDLQVKVAINEAEGLGFTSVPRGIVKFDFRAAAPVIAPPEPPRFDVVTVPDSRVLIGSPVRVEVPKPPLPPLAGPQSLGYGDEGEAVRLLQKTLNEKLEPSPDLSVDGDFGPKTDQALKAFQAENDLEVTGVVDDATREMLGLPVELPPFINN